ncbi:MAG: kelch repeat-containing protein [Gemmatimonadaceae bacterium]
MRARPVVTPLLVATLAVGCADSVAPRSDTPVSLGRWTGASVISAWTPMATTLEAPRFLPGVVTADDGRIFVFGGQISSIGFGTQPSVEVYDAATDTWSFVAPMPIGRANHVAALGSDGRIYNIAGFTGAPGVTATGSVHAYDPATDTWASAAPIPGNSRQNLAGTAGLDGRIYIAGGATVGVRLTEAAVYDPSTNTWTVIAPMPLERSSFAMATGPSGRIYAIGGAINPGPFTATAAVHAYDPTTDTWSAVASLPGTRGFHSATRGADGRIYVMGGTANATQGPTFLTDAYAYDESTDTWSPVPGPNVLKVAARAVLGADDRIYFIGGTAGSVTIPGNEVFGPVCGESPTVSLAVSPTHLWPPNHKMITVARGVSASDDCGTPSLVVTVSSNEHLNGTGDGNSSVDWLVTDNGDGTFDVAVRSERSGNGNGRVYTITATATDGDGNVTVGSGTVTVPKRK